jgi:hypothetical protein
MYSFEDMISVAGIGIIVGLLLSIVVDKVVRMFKK